MQPGTGQSVWARAERPAPGSSVPEDAVEVDARLAGELFPDFDQAGERFVLLENPASRSRTFAPLLIGSSDSTQAVRLGATLWTGLGAHVGDELGLSRLDPPIASEVVVAYSGAHPQRQVQDAIVEELRSQRVLLWPGKEQELGTGPSRVRRVRVVTASPAPCIIGETTAVNAVVDVGHLDHGHDHEHDDDHDHDHGDLTAVASSRAEIGALDADYESIRDLIARSILEPQLFTTMGMRPIKGVLLHGPPGTGKTLLARTLGTELRAHLVAASATDLIGTYAGETEGNLRSLFARAADAAPSIVLIDEIDVLALDRRSSGSTSDLRGSTQLLTLMDGLFPRDGVVVIGTTNRLESIDEAYRRPGRFDREFYVGPPVGADARMGILDVHTRSMPFTEPALQMMRTAAATRLSGATGADLMDLARRIGIAAIERTHIHAGAASGEMRVKSIEPEDVFMALGSFVPSLTGAVAGPSGPALGEFTSLDAEKSALIESISGALEGREDYREGALLTGPSGSGKTALARALASELNVAYLEADVSQVFTQWLGESENHLRSLFRRAVDLAPCVLVLDRIEALAVTDEGGANRDSGVDRRIFSTLLAELDRTLAAGGVGVIGTTDRPGALDGALTRAGRLSCAVDLTESVAPRRNDLAALLAAEVNEETAIPAEQVLSRILGRLDHSSSMADVIRAARTAGGELSTTT